ncbi:MAG: CotS family spore coat protein [Clostridia bacterium]|nr:CotS family spore coat protein [Clostridia bacterium]
MSVSGLAKKMKKHKLDPEIITQWNLEVKDLSRVKAVFRLETTEGPKCFKEVTYGEGKLLFILSAMDHLVANGFNDTVTYIPTKTGQPYVKKGESIFFVTDWIEGRDCNLDNKDHLAASCHTLARFHLAAKGLKPMPGSKVKVMWGKWPRVFIKRCRDLIIFKERARAKDRKSEFDRKFLICFQEAYSNGLKAIEILRNSNYQRLVQEASKNLTFNHRDVAARNFVIKPDGTAGLFDFDYCRYDIRTNDLVRLIERTLKNKRWDTKVADRILTLYQEINPIQHDEFPVLLAFFRFPQKLWRVADRYYGNKKPWPEREFLAKINEIMASAEKKEKFLQEFESKYC